METVTLVLSAQTYNTIVQALQEMPWKLANPALNEINPQIRAALAKTGPSDSKDSSPPPPPGEPK